MCVCVSCLDPRRRRCPNIKTKYVKCLAAGNSWFPLESDNYCQGSVVYPPSHPYRAPPTLAGTSAHLVLAPTTAHWFLIPPIRSLVKEAPDRGSALNRCICSSFQKPLPCSRGLLLSPVFFLFTTCVVSLPVQPPIVLVRNQELCFRVLPDLSFFSPSWSDFVFFLACPNKRGFLFLDTVSLRLSAFGPTRIPTQQLPS